MPMSVYLFIIREDIFVFKTGKVKNPDNFGIQKSLCKKNYNRK